MSNTVLALLSGLVGSILTVTIGKILELVQESKKHKYNLKRIFFEKKLVALESAVRLWYKSAEMAGSLSALLEQFSKKKSSMPTDLLQQQYNYLMSNYQEAIKTIDYPASAIAMYVDIQSNICDMDSYKEFLACLSEVFAKDLNIKTALEIYEKQKGLPTEKTAWQFVEEASQESDQSIKKMSKLLDAIYEDLKIVMLHARQEVKKFES